MRDDFAGDRRLGIVIAEDGDFDFAGGNGFLDENFHRELAGQVHCRRQFFARVDFAHAHGGAERCGLHEHGITEFQFDSALNCFGAVFPVVAMNGNPGHHGNFRDLKQALGDILVHTDGGTENARSNKRQSGEVEQALNRAVFSEGPVHHGKDDVNALAAAATVQLHKGGVGGIGGHHDALAAL